MPTLVAAYLGYFGFHALNGSYGVLAKAKYEEETIALQSELADLQAERAIREQRAALLRPGGIDPDMVDELARRSLNAIAPNEVLILP